jgi:hypothetical protein
MLRLISKFTITQVPSEAFPSRSEVYTFNFINACTISSSWQNLTDTAKLRFPKKIYFTDSNGVKVNWDGKNVSGTLENKSPLVLRGDKIKIELGYIYNTDSNFENREMNTEFDGYISKVGSKTPIELDCEDKMFILKQKKLPNKVYKQSEYDVQTMVREMLDQFPDTKDITLVAGTAVSQKISTKIGDFRTMEDSIGSVLDRLKKDARIYSFFRGNELRCSGLVYYPSDRVTHKFGFQKNIIEGTDNLEYRRTDDIILGAKAYSINKVELNTTNESGSKKTKRQRLETFVGKKEGEIRTLYFFGVETEAELKTLAEQELRKFYYTGYYGSFGTYGLPSVKHGDEAQMQDNTLQERDGGYLVKAVEKVFGAETGFHQQITLHLKLNEFDVKTIEAGL